jgi:SAM-dependent methyltransferase
MARRWYQNVSIGGLTFEDERRAESKFWNEGKWRNFIEPLLPEGRGTFVELGCNAGLFLKMATDAGFRDVIGVEARGQIMRQAERFRQHVGGDYRLLQRCVGGDFSAGELPVSDVILMANVHYYWSVPVFADLVDRLKSRTAYCILVSARARNREGKAVHWLDGVRGYFCDWVELETIAELDETGDPAPRQQMYGVCFKGNLEAYAVTDACDRWHAENTSRRKDLAIFPALAEFFGKVLAGEVFDFDETLLYQYWREKRPDKPPEWIRKTLAYKKWLAEDIQQNGMKEPLYYDAKGKLLDGIHRLVIAKLLDHKHVLVRRL